MKIVILPMEMFWLSQVDSFPTHLPGVTVDFKLHRDILSRYSGYFKRHFSYHALPDDHVRHPDLFGVTKYDVKSSTVDFRNLCRFMYPDPSALGTLPHVEAGDIDTWRSTIEATMEFDMPSIRAYIVTRLAQDEKAVSAHPISFLLWATGLGRDREGLMLKCYQAFTFRRIPPSYSEIGALSKDVVLKIMLIRERVRCLFFDRSTLLSSMPTSPPCPNDPDCPNWIINTLTHYMANPTPDPDNPSNLSIFEPLALTERVCDSCGVASLLDLLKERLNSEVAQHLEEPNLAEITTNMYDNPA